MHYITTRILFLSSLLLLILTSRIFTLSSAGNFLTIKTSPQNISIGPGSSSYINRLNGLLENPTSISNSNYKYRESPLEVYFSSRPFFFDEFRNNTLFFRFPDRFTGFSLDLGGFFQLISPNTIEILDNLGQKVNDIRQSFISTGFSIAKRIPLKNHILITGINLKFLYSTLGDYNAMGFASDIGISYSFSIKHPHFLPYISNEPNFTVSLVGKNLGTPLKFNTTTDTSPISYNISFRKGVYAITNHKIDVYSGFEHFVTLEKFETGIGLEYTLFKVITFRIGGVFAGNSLSAMNEFRFAPGIGIQDFKASKFSYKIDYTMERSSLSSINHVFGVGGSYFFPIIKPPGKYNPELDKEIVAEVQRFIFDIIKKKGIAPASLEEVFEEMRQRGYPKPVLTAGKMIYLRDLEQVVYLKNGSLYHKVHIVKLKDGQIILGSIIEKRDGHLKIVTNMGTITIKDELIDSVTENTLKQMDETIRLRIQYLITHYKTNIGGFPPDMETLKEYCNKHSLFMPSTVQFHLNYNPETGEIKLSKKQIKIENQEVKELNDTENSNKPKDIKEDKNTIDSNEKKQIENSNEVEVKEEKKKIENTNENQKNNNSTENLNNQNLSPSDSQKENNSTKNLNNESD